MLVVSVRSTNWLASEGKTARNSTANDLDRVGAAVDTQRDDRSWCRVEPYARKRQSKEDKINLDKEWRVPDQLNKPDDKPAQQLDVRVTQDDTAYPDDDGECHAR